MMIEKLKEQLTELVSKAEALKESQKKAEIAYWQIVGRVVQIEETIKMMEEEKNAGD